MSCQVQDKIIFVHIFHSKIFQAFGSLNYEVWTSGTSDGIGCSNSWGWCPSGVPFGSHVIWNRGEPSHPGVSYCSTMAWSQNNAPALYDVNCDNPRMVLCEVSEKVNKKFDSFATNQKFSGQCCRVQAEMPSEHLHKNCNYCFRLFFSPYNVQ